MDFGMRWSLAACYITSGNVYITRLQFGELHVSVDERQHITADLDTELKQHEPDATAEQSYAHRWIAEGTEQLHGTRQIYGGKFDVHEFR